MAEYVCAIQKLPADALLKVVSICFEGWPLVARTTGAVANTFEECWHG